MKNQLRVTRVFSLDEISRRFVQRTEKITARKEKNQVEAITSFERG
jgi:hypothetical protein